MDYAYQGRHPPTQLAAMVAHTNADLETQDWLADSGANTHITADPNTINNPVPFEGNETVGVGNGASLNIKAIGSTLVNSTMQISYLNFCSKTSFVVPLLQPTCYQLTNSALTIIACLTSLVLLLLSRTH